MDFMINDLKNMDHKMFGK